ncbi:hypothetical protein C8F01DRAFT_1294376 [Mycena amicta]|nr:hypothetical protein C8F01DRAFT_1294376 [Mycena amicta]
MPEYHDPVFPPELERIIFELAAWDDKDMMKSLLCVARRVRIWIQPLVHRVYIVSISDSTSLSRLQTLVGERPTRAKKDVLCLGVPSTIGNFSRAVIQPILSACTNIIDLGLWTADVYPKLLRDMQQLISLTRLSIDLLGLFGGENHFTLPPQGLLAPLSRVTHLDIITPTSDPSVSPKLLDVLRSPAFPALTHVAFTDFPEFIDDVLSIPERKATLRLVVICLEVTDDVHEDEDDARWEEKIKDPRFCVVRYEDFLKDWEIGAWGGRDFWARAEERVAERRATLKSVD